MSRLRRSHGPSIATDRERETIFIDYGHYHGESGVLCINQSVQMTDEGHDHMNTVWNAPSRMRLWALNSSSSCSED